MAKTRVSEWSTTPSNNTDIDGINIAENCPPSGINDAIRDMMAQIRSWQSGTYGDTFNGPVNGTVGATTPSTGSFTTLSSTGNTTLGDASGDAITINGTATFANANPTFTAGTANGVAYLNGSKVVTSGSALTFDGTNLGVGMTNPSAYLGKIGVNGNIAIGTGGIQYFWDPSNNYGWYIKNAANDLTFGNYSGSEQMRLTSTGLGIGTSSPAYKLDVNGQARLGGTTGLVFGVGTAFAGSQAEVYSTSTTPMGLGTTGAAVLRLYTNSTLQATLDQSGNLGLGVTPSAWFSNRKAIQINNAGTSIAGYSGGALTEIRNNSFLNGGGSEIYTVTAAAGIYQMNGAQHTWFTAPSGTAGNAITFTQAMTLDSSGNLLIGRSTSDGYRVATYGTTQITTGYQLTYGGVAAGSVTLTSGGAMAFGLDASTGGTERARIDSSGNLLVGTTDSGRTTGIGIKLDIAGYSTTPTVSCVGSASTNSADTYHIYSTGASAYRFYVGYGGTINATSTTITGISDRRLKENIRDLDEGLETVMALKPRKFDWKEGKGKDIKNDRGWIAQEFETVFPDMIEEWRDPAPEGEEPYKAVNANLIPTLVKAIQEQQAIINQLKARLDAANL